MSKLQNIVLLIVVEKAMFEIRMDLDVDFWREKFTAEESKQFDVKYKNQGEYILCVCSLITHLSC